MTPQFDKQIELGRCYSLDAFIVIQYKLCGYDRLEFDYPGKY